MLNRSEMNGVRLIWRKPRVALNGGENGEGWWYNNVGDNHGPNCVRPPFFPSFVFTGKKINKHTQRLDFRGSLEDLVWDASLLQKDSESDAAEASTDNNDLGFLGDRGHGLN